MAYEIPGFTMTFEASGDLSSKQFYFVKLDTNGQIAACAAVTDNPIGILQDKPAAIGRAATVMVWGVSKVSADAALALGDYVGPSVDGQAAVYVHGTDTTKYIVGQVVEAAGAGGRLGSILFSCLPNTGRAA